MHSTDPSKKSLALGDISKQYISKAIGEKNHNYYRKRKTPFSRGHDSSLRREVICVIICLALSWKQPTQICFNVANCWLKQQTHCEWSRNRKNKKKTHPTLTNSHICPISHTHTKCSHVKD